MAKIPYYFDTPVPSDFRRDGWFKNVNTLKFVTWAFSRCQTIEHEQFFDSRKILLKPYQFIFGRKKCAEELDMTEKEIRVQIDNMIEAGFLKNSTNSTTRRYTIYEWIPESFTQINTDQGPSKSGLISDFDEKGAKQRAKYSTPHNSTTEHFSETEGQVKGQAGAKWGPSKGHKEELHNHRTKENSPLPPDGSVVVSLSLSSIDNSKLSDDEKIQLAKKFTESRLALAVKFFETEKVDKSWKQAIWWHCSSPTPPVAKPSIESVFVKNMEFAAKHEGVVSDTAVFTVCSTYCEVSPTGNCQSQVFKYDQSDTKKFAHDLCEQLNSYKFCKLKTAIK